MEIKSQQLTLNRNGIFFAKKQSKNQCKSTGHTKYKYFVALTCENKLDSEGFIIDQLEINAIITIELNLKVMSCEQYCQVITKIIVEECTRRRITLYKLYVKVMPLQGKGIAIRAYMELETRFIYD